VIGGSQGARSLNLHLAGVFARQKASIDVWHQCGNNNAEQVAKSYQNSEFPVKVSEFIDDMASAYAWADLLICRAGAMTIAECCAAAKPALLIPFPHSAGDHQLKNAQAMVGAGAAIMVSNPELSDKIMVQELHGLLCNRERLQKMSDAAFSLHKPDALQSVVAVCEEYLHA
jgi:UDP-N-acetylglucosamine--N-acetylmuramyl-(pentapeptide) pyrophosphoryl-undecaprenol N-acetylglucosamine transferase